MRANRMLERRCVVAIWHTLLNHEYGMSLFTDRSSRPSNGSRLSCGALKKDSFPNLRAPPASSAC